MFSLLLLTQLNKTTSLRRRSCSRVDYGDLQGTETRHCHNYNFASILLLIVHYVPITGKDYSPSLSPIGPKYTRIYINYSKKHTQHPLSLTLTLFPSTSGAADMEKNDESPATKHRIPSTSVINPQHNSCLMNPPAMGPSV